MTNTTYRSCIGSSADRAHRNLIATKIDKEMRQLRCLAESSPNVRKRWIWELLQNGADASPDSGTMFLISISPDGDELTVAHNGRPFSADDLRYLIEQVSTKDRTKGLSGRRATTGQFGTGFLTTHLLSEVVFVRGIAAEPNLPKKHFQLTLDRSAFELSQLEASVERSKASILEIDNNPDCEVYDPGQLSTQFVYPLRDDFSRKVASEGIEDLKLCLPYSMIYYPKLVEVRIPSGITFRKRTQEKLASDVPLEIATIQQLDADGSVSNENLYLSYTKNLTTISVPVSYDVDGQLQIEQIDSGIPRLFCDLPLVGSDLFHLPCIVNNPTFEPTDFRDGILLNQVAGRIDPLVTQNRSILQDALNMYFQLVGEAAKQGWNKLYHLVNIHAMTSDVEWAAVDWHRENLLEPIRNAIRNLPIVRCHNNQELRPLANIEGQSSILIPKDPRKDVRHKLWQLASKTKNAPLVAFDESEMWSQIVWHESNFLTVDRLVLYVAKQKSLQRLEERILDGNANEWMLSFFELLQSVSNQDLEGFSTEEIFPNQNGSLVTAASLFRQREQICDQLKDLSRHFGQDVRNKLASETVPEKIAQERVINEKDVASQIETAILAICRDRTKVQQNQVALKSVLAWMRTFTEKAQLLFTTLYPLKHLLYDDEEIAANLEKAEQLDGLLLTSGLSSIDELKKLVTSNNRGFLPITQDALASMGITNHQEWEEAVREKNLADLFAHHSIPTKEMFILAQSMIERSRIAVLEYLRTCKRYDVSNHEMLAPTIIGGVRKDDRDIQIVVRPAWNNEVIIYYDAERDILDYEDTCELWADTPKGPQQITLGHLLKQSKICRFKV